jgi:hypothetical protein
MNVAVPALQHSDVLGQCAEEQTVFNPRDASVPLMPLYFSVEAGVIVSHPGFAITSPQHYRCKGQ